MSRESPPDDWRVHDMDWVEIGAYFTVIFSVIMLVFFGFKAYNLVFKDK